MSNQTQAYCVKCRETREMLDPTPTYTENGRPGTVGSCPVCGTRMFRMGLTDAHEGLPKPVVTAASVSTKARTTKSTAKGGKKKKTSKSASKSTKAAASKRTTPRTSEKSAKSTSARGAKLVIVESPSKARTVSRFLGSNYIVKASKGHVRDLLVTQLSVDVENGFEPKYRVPNDKRDTVKDLRKAMREASQIYLATDPDREGEAIAWHLMEAAEVEESRAQRVVFHEITDTAVQEAFAHPRELDMNLVNAQQARRILDRIVGYNITELLWDRVRNRLSAGRVQSIALRLVVDREREIQNFVPVEYWTLDAELEKQNRNGGKNNGFVARLVKINNQDVEFNSEGDVRPHLDILERSQYQVVEVKRGQRQRKPSAPFTTSTLQQEASRRFGFNARRTMKVAQELYEGIDIGADGVVGLITYMRTDSTTISEISQKEAREYIEGRFGASYMPEKPPVYRTKTKGAQEAHEAIRPTSVTREPSRFQSLMSRDQYKLYTLIWERFVASQMSNAIYDTIRVEIAAGLTKTDRPYLFRVSGRTIKFLGFLALYEDSNDEDAVSDDDEGRVLPDMQPDEILNLLRLLPEQHFTQPPPRYTEATLVRTLEEFGIGRPSTYAPTVSIIQERDYVEKQDKRMIPTETGQVVNDLLVRYFPDVMDFQFTARMEDYLDEISEGDMEWKPMLHNFYDPFEKQLHEAREHMPRMQQEEKVGRDCPVSGHPLVIRYGRWGKFIGCSNYPDCTYTEPYLELTGVICPKCGEEHGGELVARKTRRGRTFFGCSRYPECDYSTWKLPARPGQPAADGDEADETMVMQDESA